MYIEKLSTEIISNNVLFSRLISSSSEGTGESNILCQISHYHGGHGRAPSIATQLAHEDNGGHTHQPQTAASPWRPRRTLSLANCQFMKITGYVASLLAPSLATLLANGDHGDHHHWLHSQLIENMKTVFTDYISSSWRPAETSSYSRKKNNLSSFL